MPQRTVSLDPGGIYSVTVPWAGTDPVLVARTGNVPVVPPPPPVPPPGSVVIVNDGDPGYSAPGWQRGSGADYPEYYGSDTGYRVGAPNAGPATWAATNLSAGTYRVSATWYAYSNRATNASYSVQDGLGHLLAVKTLNQQLAPADLVEPTVRWADIGTVNLASPGTLYVRLAGQGDALLIADAVRFERLGASPPLPPPPPPSAFNIALWTTGFTASQQAIFQAAADRWSRVIVGDLPGMDYNGTPVDDILIAALAVPLDGPHGLLGVGGPDRLRSGSLLPYHGTMQFDTADLARLEADGTLGYVVCHEMGHALGFGTIWGQFGFLVGAGTSDPRFTGPRAVAEYNRTFGVNESGVPVENNGGSGSTDSHWRESVFGPEMMTSVLNPGGNPLSRITIASMEDLGYQVDYGAADAFPAMAGTFDPARREKYCCRMPGHVSIGDS